MIEKILIIDDGLSAVDTDTENQITKTLKERVKGKTVIIVSNRIKLLSMTDRIFILDEGRIEDEGVHDELISSNNFYRSMYLKQQQDTQSNS